MGNKSNKIKNYNEYEIYERINIMNYPMIIIDENIIKYRNMEIKPEILEYIRLNINILETKSFKDQYIINIKRDKQRSIIYIIENEKMLEENKKMNDINMKIILENTKLKEELEEYKKKIKKDNFKKNFISYYSHEIGNILNTLSLSIESLDKIKDEKNITEYVNYIKNGMKNIYIFHDEIKMMSVDDFMIKYNIQQYKLMDNMDGIIEMNKLNMNKLNINFEIIKPTKYKLLNINVDIDRFIEVVNNIISNAIKFTFLDDKKEEKRIKINIETDKIFKNVLESSVCTIDSETDVDKDIEKKKFIKINIEDNGIGIENTKLINIFKPFYNKRVGEEMTTGTGLKMYFCKKHIEKFDGFITINSIENIGTSVSIYIPQIISNMKKEVIISKIDYKSYNTIVPISPFTDYKNMSRFPSMKLFLEDKENKEDKEKTISKKSLETIETSETVDFLIVDDSKMNIRLMEKIITEYNKKTDKALNGMTAIDKFINRDYKIILMDYDMPLMTGCECVKKIREINRELNKNVKIIGISGIVSDDEIEKFVSCGLDGFYAKPINNIIIKEIIDKYIL
jgi:two-component system chemotaxis sensor kinase CheA